MYGNKYLISVQFNAPAFHVWSQKSYTDDEAANLSTLLILYEHILILKKYATTAPTYKIV